MNILGAVNVVFVRAPEAANIVLSTKLYPIDALEGMSEGAPNSAYGHLMAGYFEFIQEGQPNTVTGILGATYFPHNYSHPDVEEIQESQPNTVTGILGATYFPIEYNAGLEAIKAYDPDTPTGTLE